MHARHVCDQVVHCPDKDDEAHCGLACPPHCRCEGHAAACTAMPDPSHNLHLRYLDLSGAARVALDDLHLMELLFFLNLSRCGLKSVGLANMARLQTLDLSANRLAGLAALTLAGLPELRHLDLSHNPLNLSLDGNLTAFLRRGQLAHLRTLLLNDVGLGSVVDGALRPLGQLRRLELSQNHLHTFGRGALAGLRRLQELSTDATKLCCPYFHAECPALLPPACHAPTNELSSCDALLAQDLFRVALWLLAGPALLGNLGVLLYRQFWAAQTSATSFVVLVKNLCLSDFLMGVYLLMIGVADASFNDEYVAREREWRESAACTAAGFLSFLSSEVSAFTMCLITLDRALVVCLPVRRGWHVTRRAALALCGLAWAAGLALASVPLLVPDTGSYGQNGICVSLPITRQVRAHYSYNFLVFIVLNFVLFLLIGAGQALIYTAVRRTSAAAGSRDQEKEHAMARHLLVVVLTDFCCWFPIGLLGLLAAADVAVPGVVNVVAAVFVLPVNSALNPFLYTLHGVRQRRRATREARRREVTLARLRLEVKDDVGRLEHLLAAHDNRGEDGDAPHRNKQPSSV